MLGVVHGSQGAMTQEELTMTATVKTGADHMESLRDGRNIFIDGERVDDVTTHPAFQHTVRSAAAQVRYETDQVELDVKVTNHVQFQNIFVKLVFVDIESILSAYESHTGQYVFGKSGNTDVRLPSGEEAVILVSAFRNRKPYFAMHRFTIEEEQSVRLCLVESSRSEIQNIILQSF